VLSPNPKSTIDQQRATKERQEKYEQKQMERLQRGREEKERKEAMFARGIPKAKPLTKEQIMEQDIKKQLLLEQKEAMKLR